MISSITPEHHAAILEMNDEFVHWLSPLDQDALDILLDRASYRRQIGNGSGILIGYAHDIDHPNQPNLSWLRQRCENFFYIERIIISSGSHGKGYGRDLYEDIEGFARGRGYTHLTCEVNTLPDNPASHRFHLNQGFRAIGEQSFPSIAGHEEKAVRYYVKAL